MFASKLLLLLKTDREAITEASPLEARPKHLFLRMKERADKKIKSEIKEQEEAAKNGICRSEF